MNKINIACIIDDDQIYTFAVRKMIQHAQLAEKVIFFPNGRPAIEFFREYAAQKEELPDLILLDLNMPVLDGWQFMDEFVKLSPGIDKKITVYIVSSSIDEEEQQRARNMEQISDFIIKPITLEKLKEIAAQIGSDS